jgi:hypothetical protein
MATQDGSTSDFLIDDNGSIVLLIPQTLSARLWIADHVQKDGGLQPFYPTIAVEHHYIRTIIDGIQNDGLACELGGAA